MRPKHDKKMKNTRPQNQKLLKYLRPEVEKSKWTNTERELNNQSFLFQESRSLRASGVTGIEGSASASTASTSKDAAQGKLASNLITICKKKKGSAFWSNFSIQPRTSPNKFVSSSSREFEFEL